jgi:hypothetical protein
MRRVTLFLFGMFALGLVCATGCSGGKGQPKTVPVSGTVMYNGNPVEGATVSFMGEGAPRPATGVTDAKGEFQLSTYAANDGAVIGEHVVTITKIEAGPEQPAGDPTAALNDPGALARQSKEARKATGGPKSLLPKKYASSKSTPLKETVTEEGPNKFVFQLKD